MIPEYPNFKSLTLEDKPEIVKISSKFAPYSDFNFASMYSYDVNNTCKLSLLNNNLVIVMEDYLTGELFHSIMGRNEIIDSFESLTKLTKTDKNRPILRLVPEIVFHHNKKKINASFVVEPDPDNFDYIISVRHLVDLVGSMYSTKRQKINQFLKKYPNCRLKIIDTRQKQTCEEILTLFFDWATLKSTNEFETAREYNALIRYLSLSDNIKSVDFGLYVNDKLVGFTLNEIVHKGFYIGHFGKADYHFTGSFQYLEHATAKVLIKHKCKFMNFEQDLGIDGLKESKLSWHPVKYLRKYNVYQRR